jgi:hypothetical protein
VCGVFLLLLFLFLASFLVVCPLKCLRIERHLAAKTGTNFAVLVSQVLFADVIFLGWCFFLLVVFFSMSAISSGRDD